MTLEEIEEYKQYVGKRGSKGTIQLFGYTSCSLKENTALSFAWQNEETGHHKVLFHIVWSHYNNHYYLNAGAFDHEEEVLLQDGATLIVESVDEIFDKDGHKLYTLIKLRNP